MPLSEHVYCVTLTFKMTEQVEQWICIKFWIKLEHSWAETIWMIQKAAAMATGDWQLHHYVPAHAPRLMQRFLVKHQITRVTQPPKSPDLAPWDFWLFPKLKSPLKGKRFQTVDEIEGNMMGQLMETGITMWGPKVPTLRGTKVSLSNIQCFLYLVFSLINISYFSYYMSEYLQDRPRMCPVSPTGLSLSTKSIPYST